MYVVVAPGCNNLLEICCEKLDVRYCLAPTTRRYSLISRIAPRLLSQLMTKSNKLSTRARPSLLKAISCQEDISVGRIALCSHCKHVRTSSASGQKPSWIHILRCGTTEVLEYQSTLR